MRTVFSISVILMLTFFSADKAYSSILPLANANEWIYEFINQSPGPPPSTVGIALGFDEVEQLGDFCIRPLTFGDDLLSLYLGNQNEVVVLYGFRANINERNVEFFFNTGNEVSVHSGLVLHGLEDTILLQVQKGKQTRTINDQEINLEWEVRNKRIFRDALSESYIGQVAALPSTVNSGESFEMEFSLYIGPCEIEGGCNVGIFTFTFLPDVGLSKIHLRGDHPEFGGQYNRIYQLVLDPSISFDLESVENQVNSLSCQAPDKNKLKKSSLGKVANWFNIFLLIVIVLKGFKVLNGSFSKMDFPNKY